MKIKYVYFTLALLLVSSMALATTSQVEQGSVPSVDTTGIDLFNSISEVEYIIEKNPEEAINRLNDFIPTSIKMNLYRQTGYCYMLMGRSYKNLQEPSIALQYMKLAKGQFNKIDIPVILDFKEFQEKNTSPPLKHSILTLNTGHELLYLKLPTVFYKDWAEIYRQLGKYDKANEIYAILKEKIRNTSVRDEIDYIIADNHYKSTDYNAAIDIYTKLLIHEKHKNQNLNIRNCYRRIADCYQELGDTKKVQEYYSLANLGIDQTVTDSTLQIINADGTSGNSNTISGIYTNEQLKIRNEILKDDKLNSLEYLKLSKRYFKNQEYSKAERALDKYFANICYALFEDTEIEIIRDVAHHLNKNNKQEKALNYLISYEALRDTIKTHQLRLNYKSHKLGSEGLQNILNAKELQRDKELNDNKIDFLLKEQKFTNNINLLLALCLLLVTSGILYLRHISKQRKVANQQLALRSLRSQMNPHFIFNALNSVNSFISLNDERSANSFLSEFSSLMRTVMENSEHDFITLTKELEIIRIYLELEHFRFKDKFNFSLHIDEELDEDQIKLPPMLIQPYIENAVWHGLRYKKEQGQLDVEILDNYGDLKVVIKDNGIGRKKSKILKTKNQKKSKSIALKNIDDRIKIFKDLHKISVTVKIEDLYPEKEDTGTKITLNIPLRNQD